MWISISRSCCKLFSFCLQVNQKMILTLTASIMYWSLQQTSDDSQRFDASTEDTNSQKAQSDLSTTSDSEDGSVIADSVSTLTIDDSASETSQAEGGGGGLVGG